MVIISLHTGSLHYRETIIITTDVIQTHCDIFTHYWCVRVPTDYRKYKAQNIGENKMYAIIVNYAPSIQDKTICFNASFFYFYAHINRQH